MLKQSPQGLGGMKMNNNVHKQKSSESVKTISNRFINLFKI